jgi:hypothetical protein
MFLYLYSKRSSLGTRLWRDERQEVSCSFVLDSQIHENEFDKEIYFSFSPRATCQHDGKSVATVAAIRELAKAGSDLMVYVMSIIVIVPGANDRVDVRSTLGFCD